MSRFNSVYFRPMISQCVYIRDILCIVRVLPLICVAEFRGHSSIQNKEGGWQGNGVGGSKCELSNFCLPPNTMPFETFWYPRESVSPVQLSGGGVDRSCHPSQLCFSSARSCNVLCLANVPLTSCQMMGGKLSLFQPKLSPSKLSDENFSRGCFWSFRSSQ